MNDIRVAVLIGSAVNVAVGSNTHKSIDISVTE